MTITFEDNMTGDRWTEQWDREPQNGDYIELEDGCEAVVVRRTWLLDCGVRTLLVTVER